MGDQENTLYEWPDYYDWTSTGIEDDIVYYTELAREQEGSVLELGCGTGRCTLAIARENISIVGIDRSKEMLKSAREKAKAMELEEKIQWIEADMREFQVPNRTFSLIICPYRSFQHLLTVGDQLKTLRQIRQHLEDGGIFAFNIFYPHLDQLVDQNGKYQSRGSFEIPGSDETIEIYDYTEVDPFSQLLHVNRYMERYEANGKMIERIKTRFTIRYTFPTELQHLLAVYGFRIRNMYGNFDRSPFGPDSTEMIVEAVKMIR